MYINTSKLINYIQITTYILLLYTCLIGYGLIAENGYINLIGNNLMVSF